MARKKQQERDENTNNDLIIEEAMPDDAVFPAPESAAPVPETKAEQSAAGAEEQAGAEEALRWQQEIEELKARAEELLDHARRAQAELDNVRKRAARDVENAHKYALDRFVAELLPVVDSLEMGLAASTEAGDPESLRQGVELTLKMFVTALGKFGVQVIAPEGEKFNPDRHEAVSMQKVEGVESGKVITVMQKGYELNGRLVRPAMVVVSQ